MGGGAALVDMDSDGDFDLYLVQSGSIVKPGAKDPSTGSTEIAAMAPSKMRPRAAAPTSPATEWRGRR